MATEETATAKKGGIRIAIDWMDGESDSDDAFRRSSPHRGVPHPSASRKGGGLARSSHVHGGTRIHIDVRLTNPPSSAPKLNCDVFVDARSSPNHGGDVCFASLHPAASKATKGRPNVGTAGHGGSSGMSDVVLRREVAGMSDGELRREIAGLKAEARKRKGNATNSRSSADRCGDVCFASPAPAVSKRKRRREAAAEADGEYSGMSNDALRRDISEMSEGELQREIAALSTFGRLLGPEQRERHQRLLPLLQKEARRRRQRQGSTTRSRTQDGDDRNRGARTSTAKPVPFLHF